MSLCFHRWTVEGAFTGEFVFGGGHGTTALYRCGKCGDHKTETLNGRWTLAQLRAPAEPCSAHTQPRRDLGSEHEDALNSGGTKEAP